MSAPDYPGSLLSVKDREYLRDREAYLEGKKAPRQTENERKSDLKHRLRAGIIDARLVWKRFDDDRINTDWIFPQGDELVTSGLVQLISFAYRGLLEQGYSRSIISYQVAQAIEHADSVAANVNVQFEDLPPRRVHQQQRRSGKASPYQTEELFRWLDDSE